MKISVYFSGFGGGLENERFGKVVIKVQRGHRVVIGWSNFKNPEI